jgi:universal stress protein E
VTLTASEYPNPPLADARAVKLRRIVVVIDPTVHEQAALDKAVRLAEHCRSSLELYVCDAEQTIPESWTGASRAKEYREMTRLRLLGELRALAEPLKARGLEVNGFCEWHAPLEQGIGHHVIRTRPDLVVKETHRHGALSRAALSHTDWNLIRQIPVPLLLVRPRPWRAAPRIAVALDPFHPADHPGSLDESLMALGHSLAEDLNGAVDVFHVLQTPPHLPGDVVSAAQKASAHLLARNAVGRLASKFGAPVHVEEGPVAAGLVSLVNKHAPDVLLMGAVARPRWVHSAASGTAAQILEQVDCDLLVIKPPGFMSPLLVTDD